VANDRRYQEDEVAEIFEAAAAANESPRRELASTEGLTLSELQEIGREVGVSPERIAEAASALDLRRSAQPRRTDLGMPVSVERTVELSRAPTDREWELLVADLRRTFEAQGRDGSRGNLRQWTNGNLFALVEPTDAGYRLRIGSTKGNAVAINRAAAAGIMLGVVLLIVLFFTGELADDFDIPLLFGGLAATALGYNALRMPRWAAERERQMEFIVGRARALTEVAPDRVLGAGEGEREG
jgi:hypothetical protein